MQGQYITYFAGNHTLLYAIEKQRHTTLGKQKSKFKKLKKQTARDAYIKLAECSQHILVERWLYQAGRAAIHRRKSITPFYGYWLSIIPPELMRSWRLGGAIESWRVRTRASLWGTVIVLSRQRDRLVNVITVDRTCYGGQSG